MPHHGHDHHAIPEDGWKHAGVRVIPGDRLDADTAETPGMHRAAAINASSDETLQCVPVRSDNEAVAVKLDIGPVEKPEGVLWVDPFHKA
jgi:uncharacterized RmlC-like cupin family protein